MSLFHLSNKKQLLALCLCLSLAACGQRGTNTANFDDSDTGPGFGTGNVNDIAGLGSTDNGGSGSGGALTEADKQALNNLFKDTANSGVTPKDADAAAVSEAFRREVAALLEKQRQGDQAALAQLMMLAGKMLQQCSAKVGVLAPVPGQTLLGTWATPKMAATPTTGTSGSLKTGGSSQSTEYSAARLSSKTDKLNTNCSVNFTITGAGPLQQQTTNKYAVSGKTTGSMTADASGIGVVQGNPWSGNLRDTPQAGNGVLRNPAFTPATDGKNAKPAQPCDAAVELQTSANPIPANYTESVARLGCCFRQALMLMSPTMVSLMSNMDPRLAMMLVQRSGCEGSQDSSK